MNASETGSAEALESLVSQFSSALDCYRELVQNSIDAGSPRVDIWTEFIAGSGGDGTLVIHVDDYGEGMDSNIIDNQLTELFASSKENDLTKIGKFGIGFVSVFALKPKGVLVHTGRGGEYWEVFFHEDRSFTKTAIDTPVEGTQISIFIAGDRHRYNELVENTRITLDRWCAHSETEITFEDRAMTNGQGPVTINQPFEVAGDCATSVREPGTEIALAFSESPGYGFFNKGLTLLRTVDAEEAVGSSRARRFAFVSFKIKSRYLEHTLSRDTVLKDANYDKAIQLLEKAVRDHLRPRLLEEIERLAAAPRTVGGDELYMRMLTNLCGEPPELLLQNDNLRLLRTLDDTPISLAEIFRAGNRDGRVFVTSQRSAVTDLLAEQKVPVVMGRLGPHNRPTGANDGALFVTPRADPVAWLVGHYLLLREQNSVVGRLSNAFGVNLRADAFRASQWLNYEPETLTAGMLADPHHVFLAVDSNVELSAPLELLLRSAKRVLDTVSAGYARLTACRLAAPETEPPLFVVGRRLAPLMARPPEHVEETQRERRPTAAVNLDHPLVTELQAQYARHPAMASYALAKNLLLSEDRLLHRDTDLIAAAVRLHGSDAKENA